MSLNQLNFENQNKVEFAISLIQSWQTSEYYDLRFSGGKDSVVLKKLADMAGARYHATYSRTGIDPPEVTQFIKKYYPDTLFIKPKFTMWEGIERKGLPTIFTRWCCKPLKHSYGKGLVCLTGIRADESKKRSKQCFKNNYDGNILINPIFLWTDKDVWEFIHKENLQYCNLYDQGFKRIGCILCPMGRTSQRKLEAERYPKFVEAYKRASLRHAYKMGKEYVYLHEKYFNNWLNN